MLAYQTDQGFRYTDPQDPIYPLIYLSSDQATVISARYIDVSWGLHLSSEKYWLVKAEKFSFYPRNDDRFIRRLKWIPGYAMGTSAAQYQLIASKEDVMQLMFEHGKVVDSQPSVNSACESASGVIDSSETITTESADAGTTTASTEATI